MSQRYTAFTLTEVLVTLVIIGIVAIMTIPSLIANFQKQEYTVSLKKAYSQFNQILMQISVESGCVNDLKCSNLFAAKSSQFVGGEIVKYIKIAKNCETDKPGCFSDQISDFYDGSGLRSDTYSGLDYYKFTTVDGFAFAIQDDQTNCGDEYGYSSNVTNDLTAVCGMLIVDVNGPSKLPNAIGRDIFQFYIANGRGATLYPVGGIDDANMQYWKDSNGVPRACAPVNTEGYTCAARIIDEGWQMKY